MDLKDQIEYCLLKSNMTKSELAKKFGSKSLAAFRQRVDTGKFTKEELEKIASALDCTYHSYFEYDDGTKF